MTVLRSGVSVMVHVAKPTYHFGSPAKLLVGNTGAYDYIQVGLPKDLRKGATVLTAKLRLSLYGSWPGSRVMSADMVTEAWNPDYINYKNRPDVNGLHAGQTVTGGKDLDVVEFDVAAHVQRWVNGAQNLGWRISTSDAVGRYIRGFSASFGKPTLEITYIYPPATPTTLHPSSGAVSVAAPVVRWDSDTPAAVQVQIDPAANATTPAFDSGTVVTDAEELDLSTTAYAGLSLGSSTQWRVRVTNTAGQVSAWSQWATFSRAAKPTLTITSPTSTVSDPTPPIGWSSAGQTAYQVLIADSESPTKPLFDSTRIASTDQAMTPAAPVSQSGSKFLNHLGLGTSSGTPYFTPGRTSIITVRTWDGVDREATAGDPTYSEATVAVGLAYDGTVPTVSSVAAVQAGVAPWVDLSWSRANVPDGWAIFRDGVEVARLDDGFDPLVTPGTPGTGGGSTLPLTIPFVVGSTGGGSGAADATFAWRDWTAAPNVTHTYRIAAVENSKTASAGATAAVTPRGSGIWLADPENGTEVVLWDQQDLQAAYGEDSTVFNPIGASAPVRVTYSMRGLEGTGGGIILNTTLAAAYPADAMLANLFTLKANPGRVVRLVAGDINIPVTLNGVTPLPSPLTEPGDRFATVSFGFEQAGELPFAADI